MQQNIRYIITDEQLAKAIKPLFEPVLNEVKRLRKESLQLKNEVKELRLQIGNGVEIKTEVKEYMKPMEAEKYVGLGKKRLIYWANYFHITKTSTGFYRKEDLDKILEGKKQGTLR